MTGRRAALNNNDKIVLQTRFQQQDMMSNMRSLISWASEEIQQFQDFDAKSQPFSQFFNGAESGVGDNLLRDTEGYETLKFSMLQQTPKYLVTSNNKIPRTS